MAKKVQHEINYENLIEIFKAFGIIFRITIKPGYESTMLSEYFQQKDAKLVFKNISSKKTEPEIFKSVFLPHDWIGIRKTFNVSTSYGESNCESVSDICKFIFDNMQKTGIWAEKQNGETVNYNVIVSSEESDSAVKNFTFKPQGKEEEPLIVCIFRDYKKTMNRIE